MPLMIELGLDEKSCYWQGLQHVSRNHSARLLASLHACSQQNVPNKLLQMYANLCCTAPSYVIFLGGFRVRRCRHGLYFC